MKLYIYFVSGALTAGLLGAAIFWKSGPKSKDTRIKETSFRVTLPGLWAPGMLDDPKRRSYHTGSEQLTVSIFGSLFGAVSEMNDADKMAAFTRMVNRRKDAETKMPGFSHVLVTEPTLGESRGILAARYSGFDSERQRRFHCMILASSSAFEIFYYEAVDVTEEIAENRAKAIFNSVEIPK